MMLRGCFEIKQRSLTHCFVYVVRQRSPVPKARGLMSICHFKFCGSRVKWCQQQRLQSHTPQKPCHIFQRGRSDHGASNNACREPNSKNHNLNPKPAVEGTIYQRADTRYQRHSSPPGTPRSLRFRYPEVQQPLRKHPLVSVIHADLSA
ncbi:unnamed protein product [Ectocarpus sp. 12 AP-2014]